MPPTFRVPEAEKFVVDAFPSVVWPITFKVLARVVAPFTSSVPVTSPLPATVREDPGVVVPIPTLPVYCTYREFELFPIPTLPEPLYILMKNLFDTQS